MKLFDKIKEKFKPQIIVLQKVKPMFKTTDGEVHIGLTYKWANSSNLLIPVSEYMMIHIKSDGYIKDSNGVMYILANVISIDWDIVGEKCIVDNYNDYHGVIFTNDEVENAELGE